MCYDGALVMPSKFVVINKEEMMCLNGGKVTTNTYRYSSREGITQYAEYNYCNMCTTHI
ncbi:hypothetical protein DES36_11247 [Alkalibaculum bacchi]|uniref:Uncharacterized protein n=1 Tax=Alkalibaculum bacchi TaxID=645887 RepID=A0A366I2Y9_9FIRM|nr:hypothetical protein DES36_11247 [Alkalibaculum bacchi]